MQQRNLMIFFLLSFLLLVGWVQLNKHLRPAPPPAKEKEEAVKPTEKGKKPEEPLALPPQPKPTPDDKLLALGSDNPDSPYHLFVRLDPLGGGVRSVMLNKFKQATEGGLPTDKLLELVAGEANRDFPAHLLYHFDPNDATPEHPLDTLGRTVWTVVRKDGRSVVIDQANGKERQSVSFRTEALGVTITKTFSLQEGDYHLGLAVDLERPALPKDAPKSEKHREVKFRYQLTGAKGLPLEGKWYTAVFRNALLAAEDDSGGLYREMEDLRQISLWGGGYAVTKKDRGFIRYAAVAVQYFASAIVVDDQQQNQKFLERARATLETVVVRGKAKGGVPGAPWLVMTSEDGKSQETIYIPPHLRNELIGVKEGTPIAVVYRPLTFSEERKTSYKEALSVRVGDEASATHALWEDDITVRVVTEAVDLKPGSKVTHRYLLYNGPVKPSLLGLLAGDREVAQDVIDRYVKTLKLNTLTDYHSPGAMGTFASTIGWTFLVIHCTNLMHLVLAWLHWVVSSYGLCIIFLTVMVRGMMFPLSRKQALTGLRMQELGPEMKKLQEKYKDDKQALGLAQWELYRKHGVSPFGSCWVLLLQMPIFMGLYYALQESIQFRLAPFWPTWIRNLAAPDMLLRWGESIPLLSRPEDFGGFLYLGPYLNILPIIAVALSIVQQKMLMPPPADEQQEMQQKMMRWMMVFFGLMFYKMPAGLCIYFIASSLWGFTERKLLPKPKLATVGVDLDKAQASAAGSQQITTAPAGGSTAVTAGQGKKPGRNKRRGERGRSAKPEEAATGLGRLKQRLSEWWSDVLEQAKKK
jgi:YidC/Oxa1 family membrane protein insertase